MDSPQVLRIVKSAFPTAVDAATDGLVENAFPFSRVPIKSKQVPVILQCRQLSSQQPANPYQSSWCDAVTLVNRTGLSVGARATFNLRVTAHADSACCCGEVSRVSERRCGLCSDEPQPGDKHSVVSVQHRGIQHHRQTTAIAVSQATSNGRQCVGVRSQSLSNDALARLCTN